MSKVHGAQMLGSPIVEVGEPVLVVDVAGMPALPVIDGRNLTNVVSNGENIPGQHQFGSLTSYGNDASMVASQVQYTQVFLAAGLTINSMRVYRTAGGLVSRVIRLGLYDQADPDAQAGLPRNRVAETASTVTTGSSDYLDPPLTSPYAITVAGYYWIAFIAGTATPLRFQITVGSYPPGFTPLWRQSSTGVVLPATTSGLTNPQSAIAFAAAVE